jgi:hypothetical protein
VRASLPHVAASERQRAERVECVADRRAVVAGSSIGERLGEVIICRIDISNRGELLAGCAEQSRSPLDVTDLLHPLQSLVEVPTRRLLLSQEMMYPTRHPEPLHSLEALGLVRECRIIQQGEQCAKWPDHLDCLPSSDQATHGRPGLARQQCAPACDYHVVEVREALADRGAFEPSEECPVSSMRRWFPARRQVITDFVQLFGRIVVNAAEQVKRPLCIDRTSDFCRKRVNDIYQPDSTFVRRQCGQHLRPPRARSHPRKRTVERALPSRPMTGVPTTNRGFARIVA